MTEIIESRKASLDILTIIASFLVVLLHQAAQMESPSIYIYISNHGGSCCPSFCYEKRSTTAIKIEAGGLCLCPEQNC